MAGGRTTAIPQTRRRPTRPGTAALARPGRAGFGWPGVGRRPCQPAETGRTASGHHAPFRRAHDHGLAGADARRPRRPATAPDRAGARGPGGTAGRGASARSSRGTPANGTSTAGTSPVGGVAARSGRPTGGAGTALGRRTTGRSAGTGTSTAGNGAGRGDGTPPRNGSTPRGRVSRRRSRIGTVPPAATGLLRPAAITDAGGRPLPASIGARRPLRLLTRGPRPGHQRDATP